MSLIRHFTDRVVVHQRGYLFLVCWYSLICDLWKRKFLIISNQSQIWLRYVDDIFVAWKFGRHSLFDFHSEINEIANYIKFTLKLDNNAILPFLDVWLIKDNTLKRKVYRKPVKIDNVIHFNATASPNYKMAAINSFVKRKYLICSEEYIQEELNNALHYICIAKDHGFPLYNIHGIIQKHRTPHNNTPTTQPTTENFHIPPTVFEQLKRSLMKFNTYLIAPPSPRNLCNLLSAKLEMTPPLRLGFRRLWNPYPLEQ